MPARLCAYTCMYAYVYVCVHVCLRVGGEATRYNFLEAHFFSEE